ncbi:hypothetical protein NC651_028214 [Populus alba x Populus x berolinensis]|nr:hypothetical protein NC651_028214 [Populus alba x Populus x berolinensis]
MRVDEGGFSRCYPVFLPSVAFAFVYARLPLLVELLAEWSWTVALIVVIARVCRIFRFSVFSVLAPGSWIVSTAMPWFGGFIGNWFIGCVFFFSRERGENCKGRWVAVVVRGFQCVKCGIGATSIFSAC